MRKKLEPINSLLRKVKKYSKNPESNKLELAKLRKKIILQKRDMDKVDLNRIQRKIKSGDLSLSECQRYKTLLKEKKKYKNNNSLIKRVITEEYSVINERRKMEKAKLYGFLVGTALLVGVTTIGIKNKTKVNNDQQIVTEATTEEQHYLGGDEYISPEENDFVTTLEPTTEATTEVTTEVTTIATTETTTESTTEGIIDSTIDQVTEATTEATTETNTETAVNENWGFEDLNTDNIEKAKNFFDSGSKYIDKLEEFVNNPDKRADAKESAKAKSIEYIDFVFYGKEINGVKFDDLKSDAKEKAYANCQRLVNLVNEYDPDYFDNMGERYGRLKDLGTLTLEKAKNKIKDKVGEDYYNDAGDVKDDTIESIKETGGLIKKFIKDKYEEWRDN